MSKAKGKKIKNQTSIRIFIVVLIMGVIGIAGVLIQKYNADRLSDHYENEVMKIYEDQKLMDNVAGLLYRHQALVANHLRTRDEAEKDSYEYSEIICREDLKRDLTELGDRVTGGEYE